MKDIKDFTFEDSKELLSNRIYQAALLFERLENHQKIHGNGHHIAQDIQNYTLKILEERWIGKKD